LLRAGFALRNGVLGKYTGMVSLRMIVGAGRGGMSHQVLSGPDLTEINSREMRFASSQPMVGEFENHLPVSTVRWISGGSRVVVFLMLAFHMLMILGGELSVYTWRTS
jgi:hypothetical protein